MLPTTASKPQRTLLALWGERNWVNLRETTVKPISHCVDY